jgi:uncharacterized protein YcfJ
MSLVMSGCAYADHRYEQHHREGNHYERQDNDYGEYGRVLEARPIYQQQAIETPHQRCTTQTVVHEERTREGDSFTGTVAGGLVGAAIGHELGKGRGTATAIGGLIGASIGNDVSKGGRTERYRDEEVCRTQYRTEYEQRIVGYDVTYSYQGRIYQTRTDRHPGDRIALELNVRPRDN